MTIARIRFTKHGKIRFTSHRDVARMFERALRRSSVHVAYSQGFSPRPRLSFGLALSTGHESDGEYLDIMLAPDDPDDPERVGSVDADSLAAMLTETLPTGMEVVGARILDSTGDSLQQAVTSCSWEIEVPGIDLPQAAGLVADVLAADEIVVTRERKGKEITEDLRPFVRDLVVAGETPHGVLLTAELGTQPRGLRPAELLEMLGRVPEDARVRRTHQWIETDGVRAEPLVAGAASSPGVEASAP